MPAARAARRPAGTTPADSPGLRTAPRRARGRPRPGPGAAVPVTACAGSKPGPHRPSRRAPAGSTRPDDPVRTPPRLPTPSELWQSDQPAELQVQGRLRVTTLYTG